MSPVYGILDKNYRKEDVLTRDEKLASQNVKLDVDSVRKKAFGTLEEDLAKDEPKIKYYDEEIEDTDNTVVERLEDTSDVEEKLLDEVIDTEIDVTKEMEIPEEKEDIEETIEKEIEKEYEEEPMDDIDKLFEEPTLELPKTKSRTKKKQEPIDKVDEIVEEVKEETKEEKEDEVDENDLFELIDSMYENKEEE